MSNTIINAKIIDQKIQLTNTPLIASGSEGVLQIHCAFDSLWSGYEVTAVFYREEKQGINAPVYHVPVYLSSVTVPHEVLKSEGHFYFGFMGVAENTRTTEVIRLKIERGAITEGLSVPEPTPDIYTQLMQIIQQSSIIPDASLTQAGKAADAKATGEAIQQVMQDVVDMVGETADDIMDSMVDRVVERGTDATWTWEKWKSGKAVCWGTASLGNVSVNNRWGSTEDAYPWRESAAYTQDFPEGLFNVPPKFLDITVMNSSGAVFVSRYVEDLTATNTGKFTLSRPTSMTVNNVVLGFYAIGTWANTEEV